MSVRAVLVVSFAMCAGSPAFAQESRQGSGGLAQSVDSLWTEVIALEEEVDAHSAAIDALSAPTRPAYGLGAAPGAREVVQPVVVLGGTTGKAGSTFAEVSFGAGWTDAQWDAAAAAAVAALAGKEAMVCLPTQDALTGKSEGTLADGTPVELCITAQCSTKAGPGQIVVDPLTFLLAADDWRHRGEPQEIRVALCCRMP